MSGELDDVMLDRCTAAAVHGAKAAMLVGCMRGLNLRPRMLRRFKERKWDRDIRFDMACAAVSAIVARTFGLDVRVRVMVPKGTNDAPCWEAITKGAPVVDTEIVEALELDDMLKPEIISTIHR